MENYWIDTHCHMNDEVYRDDLDSYMQRAWDSNVRKCLVICMNRPDLEYTFDMQKKYPWIDIAFGYHPEDATSITEQDLVYLEEIINDPRIIAVGEIGLDYYWDKTYKDRQIELFIRQLEIAGRAGKPVLIHSRSAARDTSDILLQHASTKVLMHCFGESEEMMQVYLKRGYYIAFGGVVTFKNSVTPKKNASEVPLDRLMLETDCPYMTPVPLRGKQNETAYVYYVGEYICQLRGLEEHALQQQLQENYRRFFDAEN
ncbi:MAG: TatD family hydrolase [Erysipelotrichaceae bacterium]|nr:TatD family hydrolase [Erysipelotrichaceae bacterium]